MTTEANEVSEPNDQGVGDQPIVPHPWPDDGSCATFSVIVDELRRVVSQVYKLHARNPQVITYRGFDIGQAEKSSCLCVGELLTPERLKSIRVDQGRDAMETILSLAVQLGIEQGRRLAGEKIDNDLLRRCIENIEASFRVHDERTQEQKRDTVPPSRR